MKNIKLLLFLFSSVFMMSCLGKFVESESEKILKQNENEILAYSTKNNLLLKSTADRGFYYRITKENPLGGTVTGKQELLLAFTTKTLDGVQIDKKVATDSVFMNVFTTQAFDGFFAAVALLKEGEAGQFFIPAYMAYGQTPPTGVPVNAVVVAEIELIKLISEDEKIDLYVKKKKLSVSEKTDTGLRLIKTNQTTTNDPLKTGDVLSIKYTGMFLSETVFDSGTLSHTVGSTDLIPGFLEGIKKLKKGESAKLIFPSTLGYGSQGNSKIPPYTPLMFEIKIETVNGQ
jgi:FKBP-type peptidyl-prolyl cis-trans isomerase